MPFILGGFATWLASKLFPSLFESLLALLKDVFIWIFTEFLSLVIKILQGLNIDLSFLDVSPYMSSLTGDLGGYANALGLFEALGIIFAAVILRTSVVVIPFVGRIFK